MNRSSISVLLLAVLAFLLSGCGGGGSQTGTGIQTSPPLGVSIGAIAGPDHLQIGVRSPSTYVYSATVSGSSDTAVVWSVDNPSVAMIAAGTGVATPSASATGTVTITATAHADTSKTATLQVNVVDWILADYNAFLIRSEERRVGK